MKPFLIKLSEYIDLDINLFEKFYKYSFFHFGFSNPFERVFVHISKKEDHLALYHLIGQCAGGQVRIISLSKNDLIAKLGWNNRFEMQFKHEFPSPIKYEPIQTTLIELNTIIENVTSGYIALVGSPGTGKSTTLSKYFIENKPYIFAPYYAYIPDSYYTGIRGNRLLFSQILR